MELNPKWTDARKEEITVYIRDGRPDIDVSVPNTQATQWLVWELARRRIAFKVIQLGAGVKRVTTNTTVCPKCNGTGKC
jgi:hypothetical protein